MKERLTGGKYSLTSHINIPQCVFPLGLVTLRKTENKWQTSSHPDKEKEISLKRRKLGEKLTRRYYLKQGSHTQNKNKVFERPGFSSQATSDGTQR